MTPIAIEDPGDPRVAAYRDIRERDMVGRAGLFVAEGEVVLRVLLSPRSRVAPVSVLIDAKRVAALASLIEKAAPAPVYAAGRGVLDQIAGFPLHRGILAIGRASPAVAAATLLAEAGPRAVVVVACGIANHDNLGGIFRNAAAFGAAGVLLDAACCDPLYRKAIRVSVGATLTVLYARLADDDDPLALLRDAGFTTVALSPAGRIPLRDLRRTERMALILGTEGPGLPADLLARADTVRIAMTEGVDSLNVAVTSGIVLHHLATATHQG